MKYRKIVLLSLCSLVILYFVSVLLFGYPLVVNLSSIETKNKVMHQKGDIIEPFAGFNFNSGKWEAYIFIGKNDKMGLSKQMPNGNCLKTTNRELLKQMQKEWSFIYLGQDIVTTESSIVLYNDGKIVFDCGIVLDDSLQGLQSIEFGWLDGSNKIINSCRTFQKVYFPVIILK